MPGSTTEVIVRPCFQQDLELVQLIYAHHVVTGTGTFETVPPDLEEMTRRWSRVVTNGWPFVVACPTQDVTRLETVAFVMKGGQVVVTR